MTGIRLEDLIKRKLNRSFYQEIDNNKVSKALLGKVLLRLRPIPAGGIIIDTESFPGGLDQASHHHHGKITKRTKVLFELQKGLLYVYMVYGLHFCLGITSGDQFHQGVTLVRALKPLIGIEEIKKRRREIKIKALTNGPAKVAQALLITGKDYGLDLCGNDIIICNFLAPEEFEVETSRRIGIEDFGDGYYKKKWRFFIRETNLNRL
jgi:DNA-3-methyladenine glycosylase